MHAVLWLIVAATGGGGESTIDFDTEVVPVLTKAGCNTGACHGAAVGRGGFKLSLYGGDPQSDYRSIVLDLSGRRVNLARADASLVVLKPTEWIEHGGGYRLEYDGAGMNLLLDWIRQGAPRSERRHLQRFEVSPESYVADRVGTETQLKATAHFSDGSTVDVTPWTVFTAEDPAAVDVDPETAVAKLQRRGRHIVIARYLHRVVPLEMIVPLTDNVVELDDTPRNNFIDDEVLRLLSTLRIPVSPPADDATLLRRTTLDLTGRLPTVESVNDFVNDPSPEKHARRVDRLLDSDEFNEYWTLQLAKLLRVRSQPQDAKGALAYHRWLKARIAGAAAYDEMVQKIVTSIGDTHEVGPANFYRTVAGPREQAELTSEVFMGSRLRCANCHNHPLDRWTQDDYHGLAAIFAKLEPGRVIRLTSRGEVTNPRTGELVIPRIPGERFLEGPEDGRVALANWLTDRNNPYFAKAIVNRLWKAMMGRGLVEPSDDFRDTNPATHPRLLGMLAEDFIDHGYDLRHTLRRIALSATYARGSAALTANSADDRFYSHFFSRPLQPEVLADAISDVTGIPDQYGDQPVGTRAVALFDGNISSEGLDILGRCSREESCETAAATVGGLPRTLHMFNGSLINRRVSDSQGRLAELVAVGQSPEEIVDEFYVRALSRHPSVSEREFWHERVAGAASESQQQDILEDFLWSLLNCREFVTDH